MTDLHDRFRDWLADGARADLPRDAALHASACDACLRDAAAFDLLLAIDPGEAAIPPQSLAHAARATRPLGMLRAVVGVAAVVLLAVSLGIGAGGLLDRRADVGSASRSATPEGEGILGGVGGPSASPIPSTSDPAGSHLPSRSPDPSSDPAASEEATPPPAIAASTPQPFATPRPAAIAPPIGTPRPSSPGIATPAPTPQPSAPPSPTPPVATPVPTPTPPPPTPDPTPMPQCSDGIDNDGDLLVDFPADLGCDSAADDDETGPLP